MARSKKKHYNMKSIKAGRKTAARIKANNIVLKSLKYNLMIEKTKNILKYIAYYMSQLES